MRRPSALALACAAVLAVAAAGCVPDHPLIASPDDPWLAGTARLDSLAAADRAEDALALATQRARTVAAGLQPAWRAREAALAVQGWRERAAAPADARAALAAADRAVLEAEAFRRADSLSAAGARLREALAVRERLLGRDALETASAALALGHVEFLLSHPAEADSLARFAHPRIVAALGPAHPIVAEALELQGRVVKNFAGPAEFAHALTHYDPALRIRVSATGAGGLPVAVSLQSMGNLYRMARRPAQTIAFMRRALEIRRAHYTAPHDEIASVLSGLSFLHMSRGEWAEAERYSREALAASPPGTPPGSRAVRLGVHGQMLRQLGRDTEAARDLAAAVAIRESVWARTPRDEGTTVSSGLSLYRDLAMALAAQGRAEEAYEQFERSSSRVLLMRVGADSLATGADPWRGILGRVQRALPHDAALVAWLRTPGLPAGVHEVTWACVVRSDGPPHWVRLRLSPLRSDVRVTSRERLFAELRAASGWPLRTTSLEPVESYATAMWRDVFAPLEPHLAGVRRIVVCSPDLFGNGPLGALRDDRGRWLADRFDITYAPSALLWLSGREREGRAGAEALLVGDPAYPSASGLEPLASSAREIDAIAAVLPRARRLLGTEARAGRLRELARSGELARYGVLHVSAHATVEPRRVLDSALLLAPEPGAPGAPSRLLAREVLHWKLGADLVCLAGCGSAAGLYSPSEGWLGLQTAFLSAGARTLLVSLWPVDDRATGLLMESFYRHLARGGDGDHARALHEAQTELAAFVEHGRRPFAHPAYWSSFALVGSPGWGDAQR